MAFARSVILCTLTIIAGLTVMPVAVNSANILLVSNPGRSQFVIHNSLMLGLAAKGHNVTVVGVYPPPAKAIPNYTYIQIKLEGGHLELAEKRSSYVVQGESSLYRFFEMFKLFHRLNVQVLKSSVVDELKRTGQFDLLVLGYVLNDFQLGLAAHFGCPSVIITGTPVMLPLLDIMGNSLGASHVTHQMISGEQPKYFMHRLGSYVAWLMERVGFYLLDRYVYTPEYLANFPADRYPSLTEVKKNVSLVFFNSHISLGNPMALMPSMIEVSGIQVKKNPDPLPADVASWLDGAEHGVVFFTLGSMVKSEEMKPETVQIFLNVFGRLKQRVLWKWGGADIPNKPANLMTGAWLPQDDILAHPNVKLFLSHCGLGSIYEAKYHGVPILGLPIFGDQPANAKVIAQDGWSVILDFEHLSEESLYSGLQEMLTNDSYRQVVQKKAQLYKDRPEHPLDTATWWVDYVLRHNGAKHMQSEARNQNWVQFNSVDVIALLLAVAGVQLYIGKVVVAFAWRRIFVSKIKGD